MKEGRMQKGGYFDKINTNNDLKIVYTYNP